MLDIVVAAAARRDIRDILSWSEDNFGAAPRERYQFLIGAAIKDLAQNAYRPGSVSRPEIAPGCRTYHLKYSRKRASIAGVKVKSPRHIVVYRVRDESILEIARLLHDSMDVGTQFSSEPF